MIKLLMQAAALIPRSKGALIGLTPLHVASRFARSKAVGLLIQAGVDVNISSAEGNTPLNTWLPSKDTR